MKEFKFPLEGLLKFREFAEYRVKVKLGEINQKRIKLKNEIDHCQKQISICYESQIHAISEGAIGRQLRIYPMSIEGLYYKINMLNSELEILDQEYFQFIDELAKAQGDVKVIQDIKDKEKKIYKKELEKKIELELSEIHMAIKKGQDNEID